MVYGTVYYGEHRSTKKSWLAMDMYTWYSMVLYGIWYGILLTSAHSIAAICDRHIISLFSSHKSQNQVGHPRHISDHEPGPGGIILKAKKNILPESL